MPPPFVRCDHLVQKLIASAAERLRRRHLPALAILLQTIVRVPAGRSSWRWKPVTERRLRWPIRKTLLTACAEADPLAGARAREKAFGAGLAALAAQAEHRGRGGLARLCAGWFAVSWHLSRWHCRAGTPLSQPCSRLQVKVLQRCPETGKSRQILTPDRPVND